MAKSVQVGPLALSVAVANGQAALAADLALSASVGGGQAAGVAVSKVGVHIEEDLGVQQGADLAINLLEAIFPAEKVFLDGVKATVDGLIQKISV